MEYLEQLFNLKNKIIVITGGAGVLASEMAKGFLNAGSNVILLGRTKSKVENRVRELSNIDKNIHGSKCDVLDKQDLENTKNTIHEMYGNIDTLINAAGGNIPGATIHPDQSIFDLDLKEFSKVTDLNLDGTVLPTLILGKLITRQNKGSIINISSMAVSSAITRVVGYSAAKAAIENFTRWLAVELALKYGDGIRVNAIAPGFIITNQNRLLLTNDDGSYTNRAKDIIKRTPYKRFGEPDEIVGATLWLASDAAKFVTGVIIPIDGGFSSFSGV